MTLIPVQLPPGMYKNGTDYSARGRWFDGNLVRWVSSVLRPIGGWQRRTKSDQTTPIAALVADPDVETIRDMITYTSNSGSSHSVYGSNLGLYMVVESGDITNVSPLTGFSTSSNEPVRLAGYGTGPYGTEPYGIQRNLASATVVPVFRWNFAMWGENVLAASTKNGPIFEILPGSTINVLSNGPSDVQDIIVTDERIVMAAVNTAGDSRKIVWSDREDNNNWTPAIDNFAGSYTLQGSGEVLGLYKTLDQVLVLTEADAFVASYVGAPFVFGFSRIGNNCGPIHSKSVVQTHKFIMWLGKDAFWVYDGSLKQVPCDVITYLFDTIDLAMVSKMWAMTIPKHDEAWWGYYDKKDTNLIRYVSYNYEEGHWMVGTLNRTTGYQSGVYADPTMVSPDGIIYNHEVEKVLASGAYAISGPVELSNGNTNVAVRYVFPDTNKPNEVSLKLFTRQMPTADEVEHGPFAYNNPISTTGVLGREVRMGVYGLTSTWEVGEMRWDVQKVGGGFR